MSIVHPLDFTFDPTTVTDATVPDDGDDEDAASVTPSLELALDLAAAANQAAVDNTKKTKLKARSIMRYQRITPHFIAGEWTNINGSPFYLAVGTTARYLVVPLELPNNCLLTEIGMYIQGPAGHAAFPGGAPATMPKLDLRKIDPSAGTVSASLGAKTDASVSAALYQANHLVRITATELGGSGLTLNTSTGFYAIQVTSEGDANAITGMRFNGLYTSFTITEQDDGAS